MIEPGLVDAMELEYLSLDQARSASRLATELEDFPLELLLRENEEAIDLWVGFRAAPSERSIECSSSHHGIVELPHYTIGIQKVELILGPAVDESLEDISTSTSRAGDYLLQTYRPRRRIKVTLTQGMSPLPAAFPQAAVLLLGERLDENGAIHPITDLTRLESRVQSFRIGELRQDYFDGGAAGETRPPKSILDGLMQRAGLAKYRQQLNHA